MELVFPFQDRFIAMSQNWVSNSVHLFQASFHSANRLADGGSARASSSKIPTYRRKNRHNQINCTKHEEIEIISYQDLCAQHLDSVGPSNLPSISDRDFLSIQCPILGWRRVTWATIQLLHIPTDKRRVSRLIWFRHLISLCSRIWCTRLFNKRERR